jgi:predicted protein tyrosine phosphatase
VLGGIAFALGIVFGANASPQIDDWLSFAGALLGAAVTVTGSVFLLDRERHREERERRKLLLALLDDVDNACTPFQLANEAALQKRYGRTAKAQAREIEAAIGRLHRFRETLTPNTVRMMKVADAIAGLPIKNPDLAEAAKVAGFYPESADFGQLNFIGHEIQSQTARVRAALTG